MVFVWYARLRRSVICFGVCASMAPVVGCGSPEVSPGPAKVSSEPQTIFEKAQTAIGLVGVAWKDEQGNNGVRWLGTSFATDLDPRWVATAAHLAADLEATVADFAKRDLGPRAFVGCSTSKIIGIRSVATHPEYHPTSSNESSPDQRKKEVTTDVAWLELEGNWAGRVLQFEHSDGFAPGDELFTVGFPTEVATIGYSTEGPWKPTFKCGRLERITDMDNRKDGELLLQHNIPTIGGYSGAPLLNSESRVIGVIVEATHYRFDEPVPGKSVVSRSRPRRMIHPADINFALSAQFLSQWANDFGWPPKGRPLLNHSQEQSKQ
jgi:S1-C subfamily serine protease